MNDIVSDSRPIPFLFKPAFTEFMAVRVPVSGSGSVQTKFLVFGDLALFLTQAGLWPGNALRLSMAAVGILLASGLELVGNLVWKIVNFLVGSDDARNVAEVDAQGGRCKRCAMKSGGCGRPAKSFPGRISR